VDRRGHPRLGTTGREARRVTVSCPDSAEKVVRQLAALATVPVTYNGKPLPGPPREIRIGPQFWRRFACAAGCAACCLPFSLDLLPSERAALPPEFQRHFRERTVTVNGRRVTLATVADNWRDGRCLFLVPGRGGDLRVLGCALYPTMPLSCQSAPQFQPIYRRDEQVTYLWNRRTGHLVGGHQRLRVLLERGVKEVDVSVVDLPLEKEKALNVALNKIQGEWDEAMLAALLEELDDAGALDLTGFDRAELDVLLARLEQKLLAGGPVDLEEIGDEDTTEAPPDTLDVIVTYGAGFVVCCIAVKYGFRYGVQSSEPVCYQAGRLRGHEVAFVDCDYRNYDHARHLEAVARYRPKYATVRDVMSREQCRDAGIPYYPLDTILRWAEELEEYAEHVIVIPKYDCLDEIPERYVLGYSIPTSHGGTPLPIERFFGRRIHLLGGSPEDQYRYWRAARPYVVSIDHNYLLKISQYGQLWSPGGHSVSVTDVLGDDLVSTVFIAAAVNLARFAHLFRRKSSDDELGSLVLDGRNEA